MTRRVSIAINGEVHTTDVEARLLLSDFIRDEARLTGTHVGCEHGSCGACTVQLDGEPVRSCLMLAVQAHGRDVRTVESLAGEDGALHPLQEAFAAHHALQCGFCTPGFLMTAEALLRDTHADELDDERIRAELSGNICRCTGYEPIVAAVRSLAARSGDPARLPRSHRHASGGSSR
jgi:aerobic-type carbon monoxide dehydrogenase small subunit (CoxS/CutS family)